MMLATPPDHWTTAKEAQNDLATKKDLEIALAPLKTDLLVLKWGMAVAVACVISLIVKAFT